MAAARPLHLLLSLLSCLCLADSQLQAGDVCCLPNCWYAHVSERFGHERDSRRVASSELLVDYAEKYLELQSGDEPAAAFWSNHEWTVQDYFYSLHTPKVRRARLRGRQVSPLAPLLALTSRCLGPESGFVRSGNSFYQRTRINDSGQYSEISAHIVVRPVQPRRLAAGGGVVNCEPLRLRLQLKTASVTHEIATARNSTLPHCLGFRPHVWTPSAAPLLKSLEKFSSMQDVPDDRVSDKLLGAPLPVALLFNSGLMRTGKR